MNIINNPLFIPRRIKKKERFKENYLKQYKGLEEEKKRIEGKYKNLEEENLDYEDEMYLVESDLLELNDSLFLRVYKYYEYELKRLYSGVVTKENNKSYVENLRIIEKITISKILTELKNNNIADLELIEKTIQYNKIRNKIVHNYGRIYDENFSNQGTYSGVSVKNYTIVLEKEFLLSYVDDLFLLLDKIEQFSKTSKWI